MVNDKMKMESIWEKFKEGIQSTMDSYIPSKVLRKEISPLVSLTIKENDNKERPPLQTCKKKFRQWAEFKNYQNLCKREFKNAEMDYVNKTIHEGLENNNSKPFWRYIKSKREDNIGTAPLKRKGTLFSDS